MPEMDTSPQPIKQKDQLHTPFLLDNNLLDFTPKPTSALKPLPSTLMLVPSVEMESLKLASNVMEETAAHLPVPSSPLPLSADLLLDFAMLLRAALDPLPHALLMASSLQTPHVDNSLECAMFFWRRAVPELALNATQLLLSLQLPLSSNTGLT
jgi:hypothetical protein